MMQLSWDKLEFTWILSLPEYSEGKGKLFKHPLDPDVYDLCVRLLEIGGTKVYVFFSEQTTCRYFISEGRPIDFNTLLMIAGETGHCHTDTISYWREHPGKFHIMTGYGLSDDGIWRRHSWLMSDETELIETTIQREKYFGVAIADSQVPMFVQAYADGE